MARFLYPRFKAELLRQTLDGSLHGTELLKAYPYDADEHAADPDDEFIGDITAGALEGSAKTMTNVTVSDDGEVSFDDYSFDGFAGDSCEGILYTYDDPVLGELLVYYDDDADFEPTGAGNDINVSYSSYVFKL